MEEIRRLRIQQRLRGNLPRPEEEMSKETYASALPYFPPINDETINSYRAAYGACVIAIIFFGGLVAPMIELKMGIGGTSYLEFIESISLPTQLAKVDPIVASFCGGAVGVLTSLFIVEANNIKNKKGERCLYCRGTGYLNCGSCSGNGVAVGVVSNNGGKQACGQCGGLGKVMCTSCLCTGKMLASEHDVRLDPWN